MGEDDQKGIKPAKGLRRYKRLIGFALFVALISTPLWIWNFFPFKSYDVLVVDKTVPHPNHREHSALTWVLNHSKVKPPKGKQAWDEVVDYVGYYPEKIEKQGTVIANYYEKNFDKLMIPKRQLDEPQEPPKDVAGGFYSRGRDENGRFIGDFLLKIENGPDQVIGEAINESLLRNIDLLYLADSYGVYVNDYFDPESLSTHNDYSPCLYGGFELNEATLIQEFADSGKDVIGEFNTFASPTYGKARAVLEKVFGLHWTRWSGRFFTKLENQDEVPPWARRNYKKQYNQNWEFSGPGWVLVHEESAIVILEQEKDLTEKEFKIILPDPKTELVNGVRSEVPFRFWFDIVTPLEGTQVLAEYKFHLTESGKEKLDQFNLPAVFPAVLIRPDIGNRIYFAGDFADLGIDKGPYNVAWIDKVKSFGRVQEGYQDQSAFFWEFYVPLMKNLLGHIQTQFEEKSESQ